MLQYASGAAYLYTGVFLLLGTLGLPIPEEIITLLVGYLAGSGVVDVWLISPFTFSVILVLDNGIYWGARKLGRSFIRKWGRFILFSEKRLKRLEEYFERHGNKTVFFSRILIGFRSTGLVMAGISKMPWKNFLFWDTLSIIVFSSAMIGVGYYFHYHLDKLFRDYILVKHIIFFSIMGVIFTFLIKQLVSHHKELEHH